MKGRIVYVLLPIIPFLLGLGFRFKELYIWLQEPERFFFDGRPLITSFDGYYYAKLALDFIEGKISNPLRISLLSVLEGSLAKLFNTYPENIDLFLTPLFASLVAFPVYFYWKRLGLPLVGFLGSLTAVLTPIYLARTSIVRMDTDALNVTLPMTIALFFMLTTRVRFIYGIIFYVLSLLFVFIYEWWYLHTYITASLVGVYILYLLLEIAFNKESRRRVIFYMFTTLFISAGVLAYKKISLQWIVNKTLHVAKRWTIDLNIKGKSDIPNVAATVQELGKLDMGKIAEYTVGFEFMLYLSMLGLVLLLILKFKDMILFLPMLGIGVLIFAGAGRFGMYLAPFLGMGLGFLCYILRDNIHRLPNVHNSDSVRKYALYISAILMFIFAVPWFSLAKLRTPPHLTVEVAKGLSELDTALPKNAKILAWWDYGYAIMYYARRTVFHSGGGFNTPRTVFIAKAFSSTDQEEAFNIINGIATGALGKARKMGFYNFERKLKEGEFRREFIYPVYWTFTSNEVLKFGWIHYLGTWDFQEKEGLKLSIRQVYNCKLVETNVFKCNEGLFDFNRGIYIESEKGRRSYQIKRVIMRLSNGQIRVLPYRRMTGLYVVVIQKGKKLARYVMDEQVFYTSFVQMFILRNYDSRFFELVQDNFPHIVTYRVKSLKEVRGLTEGKD